MASHALLNAFKANKPAFGVWLTAPGIFAARTVAGAHPDLSFVVVDCEHGLIPLVPGAAETIAAIQGVNPNGGPSAVVRVPATGVSASTSWQIKNALDAGARGVIVPMVSSAEKAREIVSDCKFPPAGRRGFGNPYCHGSWGITANDYLAQANDHISVMVQIETKEAIDQVEAIAAVDGIDVLFIGPYDLSISLGYAPPNPDPHPDVEKSIRRILEAAHGAGKKCAIYCSSGKQSAARAAEGFDMINVTSDVGALSEAVAANIQAAMA